MEKANSIAILWSTLEARRAMYCEMVRTPAPREIKTWHIMIKPRSVSA
jgi:hypothetical protein